jgi:hypothetical protein
MKSKSLFLLSAMLLFTATISFAQKQLSDAEVQEFFKLIKQTKEYKTLNAKTDSINKAKGNNMQILEIHIVKKPSEQTEDHVFQAVMERSVLGMSLESYAITYDKLKKQLTNIQKQQSHIQMN